MSKQCPSCGGDCGYTKKHGCQYKGGVEGVATIARNAMGKIDLITHDYNMLVDRVCSLTGHDHVDDALDCLYAMKREIDNLRDLTPFCYMSEVYDVALFHEPPKPGSDYADMFPVYRLGRT